MILNALSKIFLSGEFENNLECTLEKKYSLMPFDYFENFLKCRFKIFDNDFR